MLKFQILLIAVLIACFAFISCERAQQIMTPVMDGSESDMMDDSMMTDDMMKDDMMDDGMMKDDMMDSGMMADDTMKDDMMDDGAMMGDDMDDDDDTQ